MYTVFHNYQTLSFLRHNLVNVRFIQACEKFPHRSVASRQHKKAEERRCYGATHKNQTKHSCFIDHMKACTQTASSTAGLPPWISVSETSSDRRERTWKWCGWEAPHDPVDCSAEPRLDWTTVRLYLRKMYLVRAAWRRFVVDLSSTKRFGTRAERGIRGCCLWMPACRSDDSIETPPTIRAVLGSIAPVHSDHFTGSFKYSL